MAKYLRKADREAMIIETALVRRQNGLKTFTVYKMARWLGMSPSSHLKKILMGLVDRGVLAVTSKKHRDNVEKAVFKLTKQAMIAMMIV